MFEQPVQFYFQIFIFCTKFLNMKSDSDIHGANVSIEVNEAGPSPAEVGSRIAKQKTVQHDKGISY